MSKERMLEYIAGAVAENMGAWASCMCPGHAADLVKLAPMLRRLGHDVNPDDYRYILELTGEDFPYCALCSVPMDDALPDTEAICGDCREAVQEADEREWALGMPG